MSNEDWSDREIDDGGRGDRAVDREIERLKAIYRQHADTLAGLAASAPTKALARRYGELMGEINRSILALDDPGALARRSTAERPLERQEPAPPPPPPSPAASPSPRSVSSVPLRTEPGTYAAADGEQSALGRIVLILGMAVALIAVLAFFVWKSGGGAPGEQEPAPLPVQEHPSEGLATSAPVPGLRVSPEAQDYGVVYKGTRVAKSFEVSNTSDRDITLEVERSDCRCLWFDHPAVVPAGGKVQLTIAVDGGLAEPGLLSEGIVISMKEHPRQATEVQITAQIR